MAFCVLYICMIKAEWRCFLNREVTPALLDKAEGGVESLNVMESVAIVKETIEQISNIAFEGEDPQASIEYDVVSKCVCQDYFARCYYGEAMSQVEVN